jgi:hypothetical protein
MPATTLFGEGTILYKNMQRDILSNKLSPGQLGVPETYSLFSSRSSKAFSPFKEQISFADDQVQNLHFLSP